MTTPRIGDVITTEWARALCAELGLPHLVERIDAEPGAFKSWVFDGISGLDDRFAAKLTGLPQATVTVIGLKHDLRYAYGDIGDRATAEQEHGDRWLLIDLLVAGATVEAAIAFWRAVRIGGDGKIIKTSFTWGFARV
jgi:hypothetical protein